MGHAWRRLAGRIDERPRSHPRSVCPGWCALPKRGTPAFLRIQLDDTRCAPRKLLLIYGTAEGQTQKIARFVADHLARVGHQTEVVNAIDETAADPRKFDAVIIAASIHAGR